MVQPLLLPSELRRFVSVALTAPDRLKHQSEDECPSECDNTPDQLPLIAVEPLTRGVEDLLSKRQRGLHGLVIR